MTFGLQCDEAASPRHPRRAPPRAASPSSTPPTSTRSAATSTTVGPHRGDRRPLAARAGAHDFVVATKCFGPMGPRPWDRGHVAQAHPGRHRRLAAPAADRLRRPLPAPHRRPEHADRRDAATRSTTSCAPARCATSAARTSSPTSWRGRSAAARLLGLGPLRLGAAALQPALPRVRARAAAAVPRGGHRRDPLQPARRRPAHRQAPPRRGPPRRAPASRSATRRERYQDRYWHEREFDTVEALRAARRPRPGCRSRPSRSPGCWPNPAITAPIVGASRPGAARRRLAAAENAARRRAQGPPRRADRRVPPGRRPALSRAPTTRGARSCP